MKHYTAFFTMAALITVLVTINSCSKSQFVPAVSMTAVNASIGINKALVSTPYTGYYSQITGVNYGASSYFVLPDGSPGIGITNSTDTSGKLYSTTLPSSAGDIYSVFIAGQAANDIIIHKDNIPYHADSSLGVRFVNLSTTNSPVNVILQPALTTEFSGIAYKSVTDFKNYSAKKTDPASYSFQVTDADGNALATSGNISTTTVRFKNVTLALIGSKDSAGSKALKVITINNYQ